MASRSICQAKTELWINLMCIYTTNSYFIMCRIPFRAKRYKSTYDSCIKLCNSSIFWMLQIVTERERERESLPEPRNTFSMQNVCNKLLNEIHLLFGKQCLHRREENQIIVWRSVRKQVNYYTYVNTVFFLKQIIIWMNAWGEWREQRGKQEMCKGQNRKFGRHFVISAH